MGTFSATEMRTANSGWTCGIQMSCSDSECVHCSQAEAAELQAFKQELCKVSGCDVLNIKCFG